MTLTDQDLTPEGVRFVDEMHERHGVSRDAVLALLDALLAGHGQMAQFTHQELGGMGQWSRGGMLMIGDMFNDQLKAKVGQLAADIAHRLGTDGPLVKPRESTLGPAHQGLQATGESADWWPQELGQPSSTGAQNASRYAYFPSSQRLVIRTDGITTVYDTRDHQITGFGQQQGGSGALTFTSQHGAVDVTQLRKVSGDEPAQPPQAPREAPVDPLDRLERLGELHRQGLLTAEEFTAAKAAVLGQI